MDADAEQQIIDLQYELYITRRKVAELHGIYREHFEALEVETKAAHVILRDLSDLIGSRVGMIDSVVAENSRLLNAQSGLLARILEAVEPPGAG